MTTLEHRPRWTPLALTPIESDDQYVQCAEHLLTIKAFQKRVTDFFKPHKERAHATWKGLCADEQHALQPAFLDERVCKQLLAAWDSAKEQARQAEEARLRDEARRAEETRRLEEAAALEREAAATGDDALREEATAVLESPIEVTGVVVAKTTPRIAGIAFRENWSAKVVSLPKLIAFVAAHPQYANLLTPNTAALNALARGLKHAMRVDGVEPVCTKTTAAGVR